MYSTPTLTSAARLRVKRPAEQGDMPAPAGPPPNDQRRDHRDDRGQEEDQLVGLVRDQLFLEDQLDPVGHRLQQAPRAGPVGPDAHLDAGQDSPLVEGQVGEAGQQDDADEHHRLDRPLQQERQGHRGSSTFAIRTGVGELMGRPRLRGSNADPREHRRMQAHGGYARCVPSQASSTSASSSRPSVAGVCGMQHHLARRQPRRAATPSGTRSIAAVVQPGDRHQQQAILFRPLVSAGSTWMSWIFAALRGAGQLDAQPLRVVVGRAAVIQVAAARSAATAAPPRPGWNSSAPDSRASRRPARRIPGRRPVEARSIPSCRPRSAVICAIRPGLARAADRGIEALHAPLAGGEACLRARRRPAAGSTTSASRAVSVRKVPAPPRSRRSHGLRPAPGRRPTGSAADDVQRAWPRPMPPAGHRRRAQPHVPGALRLPRGPDGDQAVVGPAGMVGRLQQPWRRPCASAWMPP